MSVYSLHDLRNQVNKSTNLIQKKFTTLKNNIIGKKYENSLCTNLNILQNRASMNDINLADFINNDIYNNISYIDRNSIKNEKFLSCKGYISVFNTHDLNNDIVIKSAFNSESLNKSRKEIPVLWEHRRDEPIGVVQNFDVDNHGLICYFKSPLSFARAQQLLLLYIQGLSFGLSIGFSANKFNKDIAGRRIIHSITLFEVSVVTLPANIEARIRQIQVI